MNGSGANANANDDDDGNDLMLMVMMLMIGWGLLEYHDESESTFLSIEDITAVPYSVVLQTTEVVPMAMAMSMVIIQTTLPACEIE
mmetsp:Transcript_36033/g.41414  ORF Transcript_36033/g.41414 Transcript_36033/m.41414 type:complete len:86 (-) Transcript_36033:478-735(-)